VFFVVDRIGKYGCPSVATRRIPNLNSESEKRELESGETKPHSWVKINRRQVLRRRRRRREKWRLEDRDQERFFVKYRYEV
jgi:hypothetical protein